MILNKNYLQYVTLASSKATKLFEGTTKNSEKEKENEVSNDSGKE